MTDRLLKSTVTSYQPAVAYQPAVPAYCTWQSYYVPGHYVPQGMKVITTTDPLTHLTYTYVIYTDYVWVPGGNELRQVCYPALPEVPGVPESTTYLAVTGWNAGASSVDILAGDGYFKFNICPAPVGIVIGLAASDTSLLPNEPTHALYFHGSTIEVYESGVSKLVAPIAHAVGNEYRITRGNGIVTYSAPGWTHTSSVSSFDPSVLDAALYASGDYVDNPAMVSTDPTGEVVGRLGGFTGLLSETGIYAMAAGTIGPVSGEASGRTLIEAVGTIGGFDGVLTDRSDYGTLYATVGSLRGEGQGGFPQVTFTSATGVIGPVVGVAVGQTGEVGRVGGVVGGVVGLLADRIYGEAHAQIGPFSGVADSGWPVPNEYYRTEDVFLADFYIPDETITASYTDALQLGDSWEYAYLAGDGIFDVLLVQDTLTVEAAIEAYINQTLRLSSALPGTGGEPSQYAVNVLTNAISRYKGFSFDAFASTDQDLYGCRPDGVYLIRPGDDDGAPMDASIDFGATNFGLPVAKGVDAIYLGATTDGQLFVTLRNETSERRYKVQQRGPIMRSSTARGASGRIWNISLEVLDTRHFELDLVEVLVSPTSRRWIGR